MENWRKGFHQAYGSLWISPIHVGLWKVFPGWNRVQACKIVRGSVFSLLVKHKVNYRYGKIQFFF